MNIGMFGTDDDFYFFFMQFTTADTNILTGGFQMWFQIGDTASDW